MTEVANDQNTITLKMTSGQAVVTQAASSPIQAPLSSPTVSKPRVQPVVSGKIICYDTETTGTKPWEYRLLGASFWDLSKPVSEIQSFFDFDEEKVTQDIAEYLNTEKPDVLVQYNNGFDERALLTRFMLYQIKVPGWNNIQQVDVMDILKKGTTQSIASSQPTGAEEDWLMFFFNEAKPYSIYECFEGVRNGDLTRMIIRNRTCTESEGSLYLLFREVTDVEPINAVETKPTKVNIDENIAQGVATEKCRVCGAINDVKIDSKNNQCWRCYSNLPDPDPSNILKEVLRKYDFSQVGATMKDDTATKPKPFEGGTIVLK